jgi:hypothetical protein
MKPSTFHSLILLLLLRSHLFGQWEGNFPPPANPPVVQAVEAFEKIAIDGRLDEAAWRNAPPVTEFFRIEPRQGGAVSSPAEVRILFDEKNLYVGAVCKDSLGKRGVRVQDYRRDFSWGENDIFGIQLDPQNLKRYCVSFQTTPLGTQRDFQRFDDSFTDNNWDALWSVRTTMTDSGYVAEFSIPFKTLRYQQLDADETARWGLTLTRLSRRNYEQTVFPPVPQSYSPYRMTYAAALNGLKLPPPGLNLRLQPYTLYQNSSEREVAAQTTNDNSLKIGGDAKWAINPHAVLDLTFNTDFAQAEVDRAVNNLTRFNVFFPERRQFFLENSGIWAGADNSDIVPFFSRRIGLAGEFDATPVPIDAGLRFTDRTEQHAWAGLYVHQRSNDMAPAANFGVARYLKNFGKENKAGVMLTHRFDEANNGQGFASRHNSTLTVDGLIRPRNEVTMSWLLSASHDNSRDTRGVAGRLYAGYSPNWCYAGWLSNFVSERYVPGMGFVFANNVVHHNPGGYFIVRPKKLPWIRRWDPGFFVNYYHEFKDPSRWQEFHLYLFPAYFFFTDGSFLEYAIFPTWQNVTYDFAPLGIALEQKEYFYVAQYVDYRTDASKRISGKVRVDFGDYYNGSRIATTLGARLAPSPRIALTCDYEFNHLRNLGIRKEGVETHLVTGGARLAWNADVQFSAFYQYNSFDERGRWNARLSWQFAPLSLVHVVFNQNDFRETGELSKSLITKVSWMRQL